MTEKIEPSLKTFPEYDEVFLASYLAEVRKWKIDFEAYYIALYKKLDARGYDGIDLSILEKVLGKTRKEILGIE